MPTPYEDPDAITPINPGLALSRPGPFQPTLRPTPSQSPTLKYLADLVDKIAKFCESRGERPQLWSKAAHDMLDRDKQTIDIAKTHDNLKRLLTRLQRCEFLCGYDEKKRGFTQVHPEFAVEKVIVEVKKGKDPEAPLLEESQRPNPLSYGLLLDSHTYMAAFVTFQEPFRKDEFRNAIKAIVTFYEKHHGKGTAQAWVDSAKEKHWRTGGTIWHLLGKDSRKTRCNLIVASEQVRSGGSLPNLVELVREILPAPQNVNDVHAHVQSSSANSLARISRRTASLVGYSGPAASDGGLFYI